MAAVGSRVSSLCTYEARPCLQSAPLANRTVVAEPGRSATKIFSGCGSIAATTTGTAVQMRGVVLGPRTQLLAAARAPIPQGTPAGAAEVRLRRGRVHVLVRYRAYYVKRCDIVPSNSCEIPTGMKIVRMTEWRYNIFFCCLRQTSQPPQQQNHSYGTRLRIWCDTHVLTAHCSTACCPLVEPLG